MLSYYDKNISNVICLVGDNCRTNTHIHDLATNIQFVGCYAHKLNLVVQRVITDFEEQNPTEISNNVDIDENEIEIDVKVTNLIGKVRKLMIKLNTLKFSSFLRQLTDLRPVLSNATRWTSTYNMLARLIRLIKPIRKLATVHDQILKYLPTPNEIKKINEFMKMLTTINTYQVALQGNEINIEEAQSMFNEMTALFPIALIHHFNYVNSLSKCPNFDRGVVKLIQNPTLTNLEIYSERNACSGLLNPDFNNQSSNSTDHMSVLERIKRQKLITIDKNDTKIIDSTEQTMYINAGFIPATSCMVERLFSKSRVIFSEQRKAMLPRTLETIIYLKENSDLWTLKFVEGVVDKERSKPRRNSQKSILEFSTFTTTNNNNNNTTNNNNNNESEKSDNSETDDDSSDDNDFEF